MSIHLEGAELALYIIDVENVEVFADEISQKIQECGLSSNDCLLVYSESDQTDVLKASGRAQVFYARELITQDDVKAIDEFVRDLSRRWHRDFTLEYKGVELGPLVEYPFVLYLIQLIKDILLIGRVIEQKKPHRVFVLTDRPCFADLGEIFKLDWTVLLTGGRESWKDRMLKDVVRFDGKVYDVLLEHQVVGELANSKKWILLDSFFKPHVKKAFEKKGFGVVRLDEDRLAQSAVDMVSKERFGIERMLRGLDLFDVLRKRKALKEWGRAVKLICDRNVLKYGGVNITKFVANELEEYRHKLIRPLLKYIDIWLKQLSGVNGLNAILVSNDVLPRHKALVSVAKRLEIRSIMVQHGILGATLAHDKLSVDIAAVWGDASRRWYQKYGNNDVDFRIIGNPHFDHYASLRSTNLEGQKKQLRKRFNISPTDRVIVFATQWVPLLSAGSFVDDTVRTLRALTDSIVDKPHIRLIVKLHPAESIGDYCSSLNYAEKVGMKDRVIIGSELSLADALIISDAVAIISSTVGLEAMFLEKPVIVINLSGQPDPVPYVDCSAAIGAYAKDEIAGAVAKALEPNSSPAARQARDEFIEDYAYKLDGKATDRLVDLIDSLRKD